MTWHEAFKEFHKQRKEGLNPLIKKTSKGPDTSDNPSSDFILVDLKTEVGNETVSN